MYTNRFQSTPPTREATRRVFWMRSVTRISIHASYAGGDPRGEAARFSWRHFNPRLLRGRRLLDTCYGNVREEFQSTPPTREATANQNMDLIDFLEGLPIFLVLYDLRSCGIRFFFQIFPIFRCEPPAVSVFVHTSHRSKARLYTPG